MIGKILKSTQGKPCSCPEGKLCEHCKRKKTVKPHIYIEEPHRLPVPITIKRYGTPTTTVQLLQKARRWTIPKKETPVKQTTFCSWYKRRKERRLEKKERLKRARREREMEIMEQLEAIARLQQAQTSIQRPATPIVKKVSPVVVKKQKVKKEKRVKTRTTVARPRAGTKSVYVKRYPTYDSLSNRFVNFCYRVCCQFYCYMSCIFIIGFIIIYFL